MSSSANGQSHIVHALVEFVAKGQALRATGQSHLVHEPVEAYASVTRFIRKSLRCVVLSSLDHINDPVIQDGQNQYRECASTSWCVCVCVCVCVHLHVVASIGFRILAQCIGSGLCVFLHKGSCRVRGSDRS